MNEVRDEPSADEVELSQKPETPAADALEDEKERDESAFLYAEAARMMAEFGDVACHAAIKALGLNGGNFADRSMLRRIRDELERSRPMFDADEAVLSAGKWDRHNARAALAPATLAPPFMVAPVRSSDGLLTEWPVGDHRLGGWQQ